jgi:alpha-tubulin suppressor-like RCC1 family protein
VRVRSTNDRDDLVFSVAGLPQEATWVEAGYAHSVWVQPDHTAMAVGLNENGQLGDGP